MRDPDNQNVFTRSIEVDPLPEMDNGGDSCFGNPYRSKHEQYGPEYLDRQSSDEQDIGRTVILEYN